MLPDEKPRVIEQMVRHIDIDEGNPEEAVHFHLAQFPSYEEITNWQNTYPHAHKAARSSTGSAACLLPLPVNRSRHCPPP